jgi:tRNA pseudouridine55 synthase
MPAASQNGILILDKPVGMTSRRAVDCVKKPMRPVKVGHAGTLDPLASGVLVICIGAATRMIDYVHRLPKRYRATFRLGVTSPSLDLESEVVELLDAPRPSRDEVIATLPQFTGRIDQRPPAFSALWVDGRRAYDLARKGQEVELAARPVTIHALELVRYEYPDAVFDITCGTGTYIRSLGRDIAEALGSSAVMTDLARTAIGPFERVDAMPPDQVTRESIRASWRSAAEAVPEMPRHLVNELQRDLISHGRLVAVDASAEITEIAAVDEQQQLIAILNRTEVGWRPRPNMIALN